MKGQFSARVMGTKTLAKDLQAIPQKARGRVIKSAAKAALKPVLQTAIATVPVETGVLKDNLIMVQKTTRNGTVVTKVGARRATYMVQRADGKGKARKMNPANYIHLVELGTKPHAVTKGANLRKKSQGTGLLKLHPGAKAKPFLRPALEKHRMSTEHIFGSKVGKGIERVSKRIAKAKAVA